MLDVGNKQERNFCKQSKHCKQSYIHNIDVYTYEIFFRFQIKRILRKKYIDVNIVY